MQKPSLKEPLKYVSRDIQRAVKEASAAYRRAGVSHMLVGGLAVGAHGHIRATKDVDFLVDDEAFESKGLIVSFAPGIPLMVGDVPIDSIPLDEEFGPTLACFFDEAEMSEGVPVAPIEVIFLMKLNAGRRKDHYDLIELIKVGADVDRIQAFIDAEDMLLGNMLRTLVKAAEGEDG